MQDESILRALARLTTGIYVLTVRDGDTAHGMSSSWVTQVSGNPPLIALAVDLDHRTHVALSARGHFALNVVGRHGKHLEDYFYSAAAREPDNLRSVPHSIGPQGDPILAAALAWLACSVIARYPAGDHSLFVARVDQAQVVVADDEPLTSGDLPYVYVGRVVPRR